MDRNSANRYTGSFPLVIGTTSLVLVLPCLAAVVLRATDLVTSPALLIAVPVLISLALSWAIAAFWKRRTAGSPFMFDDLMVWGWFRNRRFNHLLERADEFIGPDAGQGLDPQQRARELERLSAALEARDPRTHGHSKRVARHAAQIASRLKLPAAEVARIRTAALLHDVGKIHIPREIIDKPAALTDEEYEVIKTHPGAGAEMVESMGDPELTAIVRHHHERIDGGGYPDRISGDEIPIGARIIAVADTFDALTSARPYRSPRSHEEALTILRAEAGAQLDGDAVAAFTGRYSGRRPVALSAALLGVGRQVGQSLIGVGAGASQVAAVGAAAVVIGAAPAVKTDLVQKDKDQPAVVRTQEETSGPLTAATSTASTTTDTGTTESRGGQTGKRDRSKVQLGPGAKITDRGNGNGNGPGASPDPGSGGKDGGGDTGSGGGDTGGSDGGGSTGGSSGGSTGGSTGGSGGSSSGGGGGGGSVSTALQPVQETVQKVTQTVTDVVPTLPGSDPVSQTVNTTLGGVKDTLGKLTGKP